MSLLFFSEYKRNAAYKVFWLIVELYFTALILLHYVFFSGFFYLLVVTDLPVSFSVTFFIVLGNIGSLSIKVVKRLPVNRLPVKLPVTGFIFKLPITDLPTYRQLKLHLYSIHTLT